MYTNKIIITLCLAFLCSVSLAQIKGTAQLDSLHAKTGARFILQSKYNDLYIQDKNTAWVGSENAKSIAIDGAGFYFGKVGVRQTALGDINEDYVPKKYPKGQYFDENGLMIPANQQLKVSWRIMPSGDSDWVYIRSYWGRYLTVGGINNTGKFSLHAQWLLYSGNALNQQKWRLVRVQ